MLQSVAKKRNPRAIAQQRIEREFENGLRKIAARVGEIINGLGPLEVHMFPGIQDFLEHYAQVIAPWAQKTAEGMVARANAADLDAWQLQSTTISESLRRQVLNTPIGITYNQLVDSSAANIRKIPIHAAQRIGRLATEHMLGGYRGDMLRKMIEASGDVSRSYAVMVARTSVSTAQTMLYRARAEHAGSPGYIWRTVGDQDVRDTHARLNGEFILWSNPPEADPGVIAHAGCPPNCRCYPDAVFSPQAVDSTAVDRYITA